jgi:hypothetical protein
VVTGPELLDSIRSGFSSLLFAKFLFRVTDTRERARGTGESCLHPPELALRLERSRANQPGPTFPQSPGIILETFNLNLLTAAAHLSATAVNSVGAFLGSVGSLSS